jgi:hypothetical protein
MNIIGQGNAGTKKDIVFDDRELGDIDIVMDSNVVPDYATVVDDGVSPDTEIITYVVLFSHHYIVPRLKTMANMTATIDYGTGPNVGTGANDKQVVLATGRRVAESHPGIHDNPFS